MEEESKDGSFGAQRSIPVRSQPIKEEVYQRQIEPQDYEDYEEYEEFAQMGSCFFDMEPQEAAFDSPIKEDLSYLLAPPSEQTQ